MYAKKVGKTRRNRFTGAASYRTQFGTGENKLSRERVVASKIFTVAGAIRNYGYFRTATSRAGQMPCE